VGLDLIEQARANTFIHSYQDPTLRLAAEIAAIGLSRIMELQALVGAEPEAVCIIGPDASPSRNEHRSAAGFITGAKYVWKSDGKPVLPVGFGSNACGLSVVALHEEAPLAEVRKRLDAVASEKAQIDGINIEFDFARRNHFIEVFEVTEVLDSREFDKHVGSSHAAILHCSAPELKTRSNFGFGLQYDQSPELRSMCYAALPDNPTGLPCLTGSNAERYYSLAAYAEEFSAAKRHYIAQRLFPDYRDISNTVHHNVIGVGEAVLGCQRFSPDTCYAFLLGPDAPSYLVVGLANSALRAGRLADVAAGNSEFVELALQGANVIPHGGGFYFPFVSSSSVSTPDGRQVIQIETTTGNVMQVPNMSDLPYLFRDRQTLEWCQRKGLVKVIAEIRPIQCFRI
jgi:hypothetical protein